MYVVTTTRVIYKNDQPHPPMKSNLPPDNFTFILSQPIIIKRTPPPPRPCSLFFSLPSSLPSPSPSPSSSQSPPRKPKILSSTTSNLLKTAPSSALQPSTPPSPKSASSETPAKQPACTFPTYEISICYHCRWKSPIIIIIIIRSVIRSVIRRGKKGKCPLLLIRHLQSPLRQVFPHHHKFFFYFRSDLTYEENWMGSKQIN